MSYITNDHDYVIVLLCLPACLPAWLAGCLAGWLSVCLSVTLISVFFITL